MKFIHGVHIAIVALAGLSIPLVECRDVTHEDIRDAMLSLVRMFRTSEDKLERHEAREKGLGEQLKKALLGLDKKLRALEPLKGAISRLDERLSNVETILMQKEDREKQQLQKNNDSMDAIRTTVQKMTDSLTGVIRTEVTKLIPVDNNLTADKESDAKIALLEQKLDKIVNAATTNLNAIKDDVKYLKNTLTKDAIRTACSDYEINPLGKHIKETEKLLTKYEQKLNEYNLTNNQIQTDFVPLNEIALADEAWHSKLSNVLEKQEKTLEDIQNSLSSSQGIMKGLVSQEHLKTSTNQTLDAIHGLQYNILSVAEKDVSNVKSSLDELAKQLDNSQEILLSNLAEASNMTENMFSDVSIRNEQISKEIKELSKVERVMVRTADNVLETKRRIEYGVHQILLEVGELIKQQGQDINNTLNERLDDIQFTIVQNQTAALSNLGSKVEEETSEVWRQIGVMYQQLSASKAVLDKLQTQTDTYVNSSGDALENMEGKISQITTRMNEVDENLNYLLGKLSLMTHEFNQIRLGLGDALEKMKSSFQTVKDKLNDVGPGPHQIPESAKTEDDADPPKVSSTN